MKNYKLTNRGKMFITTYLLAMLWSYFYMPLVFFSLSGILLLMILLEVANYLKAIGDNTSDHETNELSESENENATDLTTKVNSKKAVEVESLELDKNLKANESEDLEMLEKNTEAYRDIVEGYESLEEDMKSIEKDLEAIEKKALVKASVSTDKSSIEAYYAQKKEDIAKGIELNSNELTADFEENSLIDSFFENIKDFLTFKRYKKDSLVLHEHFGIGKVVDASEETLKVSFINDQIEEKIEFEYDKNKKIPELNLFKAPKDEDERHYYYNYKTDVTKELLNTIEKIDLNFPDLKYQRNVFIKSKGTSERYEFIAISDKVHVFSQSDMEIKLLESLLEEVDVEVKKHEVSDYNAINSFLLKSKIKGIMSLEKMDRINQIISENNVKDFNDRIGYLEKN